MTEQRPSYHLFFCPDCESESRVLFPKPLPSHLHQCSRIKLTCPACHESRELYVFLLDRIMRAPAPELQTVEAESISPRDPNPDPDARIKWQQEIFLKRAARFKAVRCA